MSQIFDLQLAIGTLAADAQQLGVPCKLLQQICIKVSVSITEQPAPQLWLCYEVWLPSSKLAVQLDWPSWHPEAVRFTDYLWQRTCLECFMTTNLSDKDANTNHYIEVNASPSGEYALYQFADYRTPSVLPPKPLLKADGVTPVAVHWSVPSSNARRPQLAKLSPYFTLNSKLIDAATNLTAAPFIYRHYYQRRFYLSLDELWVSFSNISQPSNSNRLAAATGFGASRAVEIKLLHPCVILQFGETHLYFAPNHASPPDFHQRRCWSDFDYKAAQSKPSL